MYQHYFISSLYQFKFVYYYLFINFFISVFYTNLSYSYINFFLYQLLVILYEIILFFIIIFKKDKIKTFTIKNTKKLKKLKECALIRT